LRRNVFYWALQFVSVVSSAIPIASTRRSGYILAMSEYAIPVSDAAKDFLRVLDFVTTRGEPATLVRDGYAVARLVPLHQPAATCHELAEQWPKLPKLAPEEAAAFADDVEQARAQLPRPKPAWD